jgi:hypothetical protein
MVAVVPLAWKGEARALAARVRLNAIVARTSQAAPAVNRPDGRCASGPVLRSATTCSTMAWPWWVASAGAQALDPARDQPRGHALGLAAAGERSERRLGDLGVPDQALLVVPDRVRLVDRRPRTTASGGAGHAKL